MCLHVMLFITFEDGVLVSGMTQRGVVCGFWGCAPLERTLLLKEL